MQTFYTIKRCQACGATHTIPTTHWDESTGITFEFKCPTNGFAVRVEQPAGHSVPVALTDMTCETCGKARYRIDQQTAPMGGTVTQWLVCSNEGCAAKAQRMINLATGRLVVGTRG